MSMLTPSSGLDRQEGFYRREGSWVGLDPDAGHALDLELTKSEIKEHPKYTLLFPRPIQRPSDEGEVFRPALMPTRKEERILLGKGSFKKVYALDLIEGFSSKGEIHLRKAALCLTKVPNGKSQEDPKVMKFFYTMQNEKEALRAVEEIYDNEEAKQNPGMMNFPLTRGLAFFKEYIPLGSSLYFGNVQEYCPTDLKKYASYKKSEGEKIGERELSDMLADVLSGLFYLHRRDIVHRDIKPSNIFLTERQQVKIGDYGFTGKISKITNIAGTAFYLSPPLFLLREKNESAEAIKAFVIKDGDAFKEGDVWAAMASFSEIYHELSHPAIWGMETPPDKAALKELLENSFREKSFTLYPPIPEGSFLAGFLKKYLTPFQQGEKSTALLVSELVRAY